MFGLRGYKKVFLGVVLSLCASFSLNGCATSDFGIATRSDIGKLQWMLNELRSDVRALDSRVKKVEVLLSDRKEGLKKRIEGLEDSQKATAKAVSDIFFKTQSLTEDIQQLTGNLEELQHSYEQGLKESVKDDEAFRTQLKELKLAVEEMGKRIGQLEQSFALIEERKEEAIKRPEKKVEKGDIKETYVAAYEAYKAGRTKEARDMFKSLLKNYPDNEYSDNARFWIGETYYKEGNYEDAILAYEELFRKNPDSDKVPGAMLKQGLAFYELKNKEMGRLILERLIEKFPDSEQAKIAKKKLKES